ncbi:MAG: ATP-binding cassette domain-containing protein [Bacteroidales bacterium]|nr:ATP-binding cassette domain-containing protein [Bacteroidales bacterium]
MANLEDIPAVNANGNIVELRGALVMQEENIVLRDVNIDIKKGEFVYLIGRVGSGKSSLLKTLYAELPFSGDDSYVVGYDLNNIGSREIPYLRRRMGIVFQDFQLLSDRNVYDNLTFVLKATGWKSKNDIDRRIREVLSQVDMVHKGYKMPHQLSGGEQQRVAIARALLNSPELILADEPTGNLDPDTTDALMQLLVQINKDGKTIVMATHNYNVVRNYPTRTLKCENSMIGEYRDEPFEFDFMN